MDLLVGHLRIDIDDVQLDAPVIGMLANRKLIRMGCALHHRGGIYLYLHGHSTALLTERPGSVNE